MSFSGTCSCRGHHKRSIVGHCHWVVQDFGSNGFCPTDIEWRRHCCANNERESFREGADREESPQSVDADGESHELDSRLDGGRDSGLGGGLDGARDCGLDNDLDGEQDSGWNFRQDDRWHGRLEGGRVGGWDGAPRSSNRGTPVKLIYYYIKCCQRCNVPDVANSYSAEHAAHRNHYGLINGGSDSLGDGGRPIDGGEMVLAGHRRRSSRRQRPRLFHGTDWF